MWGLIGLVGLLLVFGAVGVVSMTGQQDASASSTRAPYTPPPADPDPATVSILSDSHAFNEGSWWRTTVYNRSVQGVVSGAFESQPGASAQTLTDRLDAATASGGYVIVQAGTNDLLSAVTPSDALARIEALWDGIGERGATAIASLVPPSDERPSQTVELNELISAAAGQRGMFLLDVYSPVANPDGTWQEGLSGDGIHANPDGAVIMADAARGQIESWGLTPD